MKIPPIAAFNKLTYRFGSTMPASLSKSTAWMYMQHEHILNECDLTH